MKEFIHPDFACRRATPNEDGYDFTAAHKSVEDTIRDSLIAQGLLRDADAAFFADANKRMQAKP